MGALAISPVAALDLSRTAASLDLSNGLSRGLESVAVATWIDGSSWIPYLLLVGLEQTRVGGLSLQYDPQLWVPSSRWGC